MTSSKEKAGEHPLATGLRGGIESFQLDRSCAMLLLAGAGMAALGVVGAMVVGAVREVDVTWVALLFVGAAALSALVGGWIWRRSRRHGVRPLGLRIFAVVELLFFVPFLALQAIAAWLAGSWRAVGHLLFLGFWTFHAIWFWRMGGRAPAAGGQDASTAREP